MAEDQGTPPARIALVVAELRERRLVAGEDGAAALTAGGAPRRTARSPRGCELLHEVLADPAADRRPEVDALLRRLARELAGEPPA